MRHHHRLQLTLVSVLALGATACAPFHMKDPPGGFVEVEGWSGHSRMKALDNVGLNVRSFSNFDGGDMEFWAGDLEKKLGERKYTLTTKSDVVSKNGVKGKRFDFDYTPPGDKDEVTPKFYTVVVFVTKKNRVVVECAGDMEHAGTYRGRINEIARSITVRNREP